MVAIAGSRRDGDGGGGIVSAVLEPADCTNCAHCGLRVPAGATADEHGRRFCCAGCAAVYEVLRSEDLTRYYDVASAIDGLSRRPAKPSDRSYAEFDDPAFHALYVESAPGGACRTSWYLEDMSCAACIWLVEEATQRLPGVREARADIGRGRLDLVFDAAAIQLSAVARRLDRVGHAPHPYRGIDRDQARRREDRALLVRIGVAGAVVGNVMLMAIALYAGWLGDMDAADTQFFRWLSMIATVPALTYAAMPFFRGALTSVRARRLHLDVPLALGIVVGLAWGALNVVSRRGEIYFDSLSMLVFLLLVARWVQARHHRRASTAAEMLLGLTSSRAHRLAKASTGGAEATAQANPATATTTAAEDVPIEAVIPGDTLEVLAGEVIPVDGEVVRGSSSIDVALLTGEALPIEVGVGSAVFAGTLNVGARIAIVAHATGEATRVGGIVARIQEQRGRRSQIEQLVDKISGPFVAVVLLAAAVVFLVHGLRTSWSVGAEHAMALLIVTCPCALALATPLAVAFALGRAARRGVLIKGADALERLAVPGTIVLDKTGTLTHGRLSLVKAVPGDGDLMAVAALEAGISHPVARALVAAWPGDADRAAKAANNDEPAEMATNVVYRPARGVSGTFAGHDYMIGAPAWIAQYAAMPPDLATLAAATQASLGAGHSPVYVAKDNVVSSVVWLADVPREDASAAVAEMRAAGWRIKVCSGDAISTVAEVAGRLGVPAGDCMGAATPEQKLEFVTALRALGPVVMVGDGVNDAAALAAATCGIAVHGSADASIDAADVFLRREGLMPVVELLRGARQTIAVMRRNFSISTAYNLVTGGLAAFGYIHPLWAAILMPLSSLSVLASSARNRAFREVP